MRALRRAHRDDHASRRDWHLYPRIYASTINQMEARLIWSEAERKHNWRKHGLDFAHARWVLDSQYRLDVEVERGGELRIQSFSYVLDVLAVLTVDGRRDWTPALPADERLLAAFRRHQAGDKGFGASLGNDVTRLQAIIPTCAAVLAAWRAAGG